MLTLDELKSKPFGTILGAGITHNPILHKFPVRWVAKVGDGFYDWAIYYELPEHSWDYVLTNGEKMFSDDIIRELIPCEDAVLTLYRK